MDNIRGPKSETKKNLNLPLVAGCSVAYKLTFCVLMNGTSVWFYHADVQYVQVFIFLFC